jgi:hypothetical protein
MHAARLAVLRAGMRSFGTQIVPTRGITGYYGDSELNLEEFIVHRNPWKGLVHCHRNPSARS